MDNSYRDTWWCVLFIGGPQPLFRDKGWHAIPLNHAFACLPIMYIFDLGPDIWRLLDVYFLHRRVMSRKMY